MLHIKDLKFAFINRYSNVLLNIGTNLVLARILSPYDYGIVSAVTVLVIFFSLLADFGLGVGFIQSNKFSENEKISIFNFNIIISIFFSIIFFCSHGLVGFLYDNIIYEKIIKYLSISLFFSSALSIPKANLIQKHKFDLIAKVEIGSGLISSIMAIIFAFSGFTFWALIFKSFIFSILCFSGFLYFSPELLSLYISIKPIKKIASYSSYQFGFNFINYFARNLDNILIGKFLGIKTLGLYSQAYQLMLYPISNLVHVLTPVLHSSYSKYHENSTDVFENYLKLLKILFVLGVGISTFCFFSAKDLILIIYGKNWIDAIPIFKILCLSIWIQMITASTGGIFQSLNKTNLLFWAGVCSTFFLVSTILIGILYFKDIYITSILIVIGYFLSSIVTFFVLFYFGFKLKINFEFYEILKVTVTLMIYTGVMFLLQNKVESNLLKLLLYLLLFAVNTFLLLKNEIKQLWKRK